MDFPFVLYSYCHFFVCMALFNQSFQRTKHQGDDASTCCSGPVLGAQKLPRRRGVSDQAVEALAFREGSEGEVRATNMMLLFDDVWCCWFLFSFCEWIEPSWNNWKHWSGSKQASKWNKVWKSLHFTITFGIDSTQLVGKCAGCVPFLCVHKMLPRPTGLTWHVAGVTWFMDY